MGRFHDGDELPPCCWPVCCCCCWDTGDTELLIGRSVEVSWSEAGFELPEFGPIIVTRELGVGGS